MAHSIRHLVLVSFLTAAFPCGAADMQPDASGRLEEVVVTSQRREEKLQEVPISITALNTRAIEQKQIIDVASLNKIAPSLFAKQTTTPAEITVTIRGITQLDPQLNADPAVATYLDGVYFAIPSGANASMVDIERVEVLKGPQATLFGRNTIGGAISITTRKPTDRFEGYAKVDLANHDQQTYEAVANLPINPGVFDTRFVYQHTDRGGYGTHITTQDPTGELNQSYFRGSAAWHPNDDWEVLVSGYYSKSTGTSMGPRLNYLNPNSILFDTTPLFPSGPSFADLFPGLNDYVNLADFHDSAAELAEHFRLEQKAGTSTITGDLGDGLNVKSITSYRRVEYSPEQDLDGTPFSILELTYPVEATTVSQELQLYGKALDDRLNWITGLYYFHLSGRSFFHLQALFPPLRNAGSVTENASYAGFAQVDYELTPQLRVTVGGRYTYDTRDVDYRDHYEDSAGGSYIRCDLPNVYQTAASFDSPVPRSACHEKSSANFDYVAFTLGVDYQPQENTLLYAKLSRGYRSGAYGATSVAPDFPPFAAGVTANEAAQNNALKADLTETPVSPEEILSPEIGFKLQLLGDTLRINGAAYYSRYKNVQTTRAITSPITGQTSGVVVNTGNAKIYGGELEAVALFGALEVDASLGITKPAYDKKAGLVSGLDYGQGYGTDFINAPHTSWTLGASYPLATKLGTATFAANYSWHSETHTYTNNSVGLPPSLRVPESASLQPSVGLIDASVTFELRNHPVTLMLWGQNLADKEYYSSSVSLPFPLAFNVNWPAPPRSFGGSIKYSFD